MPPSKLDVQINHAHLTALKGRGGRRDVEGMYLKNLQFFWLILTGLDRRPLTILMSNLVCSMNVRDSLADTPSSGCSSSRRHSEEDYGGEPSQPQLVLQKTGQEMAEAL